MNELIQLARKTANAWRGTDTYHQAAILIDALCDQLEVKQSSDITEEMANHE